MIWDWSLFLLFQLYAVLWASGTIRQEGMPWWLGAGLFQVFAVTFGLKILCNDGCPSWMGDFSYQTLLSVVQVGAFVSLLASAVVFIVIRLYMK